MELTEQLWLLFGNPFPGLPSYKGAVFRCSLKYVEDGPSKGLVVATVSKRGPHAFRSLHFVGLFVLGPSRSWIDKALEIRRSSEEPFAQLLES